MKDADVFDLASHAGIAIEWQDYAGRPHGVSLDTVRHILAALGLPCASAGDLAQSRAQLETTAPPPLIAATTHQPVTLPCAGATPSRLRIIHEDGTIAEMSPERAANGYVLPPIARPGYHRIEINIRQHADAGGCPGTLRHDNRSSPVRIALGDWPFKPTACVHRATVASAICRASSISRGRRRR